jgi:hypothetical protein
MLKKIVAMAICTVAFAMSATAQTVTGTGTVNTVPMVTATTSTTTTLGNSPITFASGITTINGTAGSNINTWLSEGGTNAVGSFALQTPTSSNTGKNDQYVWYFNEDSIHVPTRALSLYQFPSDSLGGFQHVQATFGITSTGSSYQYFSGNVGIGTTTPGAMLEVDGNVKLTSGSGASITFADGTVQSTAWNGTTLGGDYAESVDVRGNRAGYEAGDVIVIDDAVTGRFDKSTKPYSKLVAGVFSTKPGLIGRRVIAERSDKDAEVPMAMVGIVPTKVSTENGPIARGDLLVSSSIPGYAMKGTDRDRLTGAVIGKALAPLNTGSGVIEVLLSLQ